MNKEFTESEWSKMSCMVNVIWGVDIDKVKLLETESGATNIQFPVLDPEFRPYWLEDNVSLEKVLSRPIFTNEIVSIDRWLIPWKVKAGYSAQLNMLVYRVEP